MDKSMPRLKNVANFILTVFYVVFIGSIHAAGAQDSGLSNNAITLENSANNLDHSVALNWAPNEERLGKPPMLSGDPELIISIAPFFWFAWFSKSEFALEKADEVADHYGLQVGIQKGKYSFIAQSIYSEFNGKNLEELPGIGTLTFEAKVERADSDLLFIYTLDPVWNKRIFPSVGIGFKFVYFEEVLKSETLGPIGGTREQGASRGKNTAITLVPYLYLGINVHIAPKLFLGGSVSGGYGYIDKSSDFISTLETVDDHDVGLTAGDIGLKFILTPGGVIGMGVKYQKFLGAGGRDPELWGPYFSVAIRF